MDTKIVPFEEMKFDDNEIAVDEVSVTYIQNADCCQNHEEDVQELKVTAQNNGAARFIRFYTGKTGWAIDNPEGILKVLYDFVNRAGIVYDDVETTEEEVEKKKVINAMKTLGTIDIPPQV